MKPQTMGRIASALLVSLMILGFLGPALVQAYSGTYSPGSPISLTSNLGNLNDAYWGSTCYTGNTLYVFYLDTATGKEYYSTSTNGIVFSAPQVAFTLTGLNAGGFTGTAIVTTAREVQQCRGNLFSAAWMDETGGTYDVLHWQFCQLQNGGIQTCNSANNAYTQHGTQYHFAASSSVGSIRLLNTYWWITTNDQGVGRKTFNNYLITTGVFCSYGMCSVKNDTDMQAPYDIGYTGSLYVLIGSPGTGTTTALKYEVSPDGLSWGSITTVTTAHAGNTYFQGGSVGIGGDTGLISAPTDGGVYAFYVDGGACTSAAALAIGSGSDCLESTLIKGTGSYIQTDIAQAPANDPVAVTTDGSGQFYAAVEWQTNGGTGEYAFTTTGFSGSWSANGFVGAGKYQGTTHFPAGLGELVQPGANAFVISSQAIVAPYTVYAQVFGTTALTTPATQTQTVGTCPSAGNGKVLLVNNTQYWYSGNALGSEVVNTVQTEVGNTIGSGSHTLQLMLYVSAGQSPSVTYPAVLAWSQSVVITSGTTNQTITYQVNIPLNSIVSNPLPFNFWAVAIVGDDHIRIVQSTLSGLTSQTGAASTAAQPASFTSSGATSAKKLGLCAQGSYQSVLPAVTVTTTTGGTTSTTVSTTTTATISTIGPTLFTTASNWPVIFLILMLPAGLFLGATRTLAGALLGLVIGSVIGLMMGIIPPFVFAGVLIALASVAFIARERSS